MATTNVPEFIKNIDWSELRNQKGLLLSTIEDMRENENKASYYADSIDALEGILSLIDAVQDYAVDTAEIVKAVDVYDMVS